MYRAHVRVTTASSRVAAGKISREDDGKRGKIQL